MCFSSNRRVHRPASLGGSVCANAGILARVIILDECAPDDTTYSFGLGTQPLFQSTTTGNEPTKIPIKLDATPY